MYAVPPRNCDPVSWLPESLVQQPMMMVRYIGVFDLNILIILEGSVCLVMVCIAKSCRQ